MKKKFLTLITVLTVGALTACSGPELPIKSNEEGANSESEQIKLPNTMDEAINKLYELGRTKGFEITFATAGEDDEGNDILDSTTIGFKSDIFWVDEDSAYKKVDNTLELYEYNPTTEVYDFESAIQENEQLSFDYLIKTLTGSLYVGYQIAGDQSVGFISAEKDVKFLGRDAKEYTFSYASVEVQANVTLVFDNETGVTLKVAASAVTMTDASSAEYEVTSFKVGDAVRVPTLNKSSSGEQGGEGETANFSNIKLAYVSHTNANIYVDSTLSLFSDGSFELVFLQNGYAVIFIGTYTVNSDSTMANLVATSVYKEQSKEMTTVNENWSLTYSDGLYVLKVSETGLVNYVDSHEKPSHATIPGQGGQGEQGEKNRFVNHKFNCFRHNGATMYSESTLTLFEDGTFEFVFKDNNKLVVFIGVYTVNEADTIATLTVKKVYKEQSGSYSQVSQTWTFVYNTADYYTLTINASTAPDYEISNGQPVHADIPSEGGQGGQTTPDNSEVTAQVWANLITDGGLCTKDSNFTAIVSTSDNEKGFAKYELDKAKVHYVYVDASGTNDQYYVYNDDGMTRTYYYQDNYGAWQMGSGYASIEDLNNSLGILPIPFDKVMFSPTAKAYTTAKWEDVYGIAYTNIMVKFEDGVLKQIHYTDSINIYHEINFSKYGTTSVTLPELGGGDYPTQAQLNDLVRNRVYIYDSALDNSQEYAYASKFNEFFNGNTISFFTDDSFELTYERVANFETGEIVNNKTTFIGTYQVKEDTDKKGYNSIQLSVNKLVVDGYLIQDNIGETLSIRITPNENKVTIWEYDQDIVTYYHKSESLTPTHITYSTEQPPVESKWPAAAIAEELAKLNLNVTLPAPKTADEKISSVNYAANNGALNITVTFVDEISCVTEFVNYIGSDNTDFTIDYNKSDTENFKYVYLTADKLITLTLILDQDNQKMSIIVDNNNATVYPREAIAQYFIDKEVGDSLPYLAMDNVMYDFNSTVGYLSFAPIGENTVANIKENIISVLSNSNFKVIYMADSDNVLQPLYVAPEFKYAVMIIDSPYEDGAVWAYISTDVDSIKDLYSFAYPTAAINESIPAGLRDNLPSFDFNGFVYAYVDNGESHDLHVNVQPDASASKILEVYQERLEAAGYILNEGVYTSANGEVKITLENKEDKIIIVNIAFNVEDETITYTLIKDNDWDILADDAKIYAYVWNNKGEYQWIELNAEEGGSFNLEISSTWVGCKIVRFSPDSEIGWKNGPNGEVNPDVTIWNETGDIVLNGKTGEIHFTLLG